MKYINNIIRAMALVAVMIVTMASALAHTAVEYIDKDGAEQTCEAYTVVGEGTTQWNAGWYLVNSTLEINGGVTVTGAVNLILADGASLTVTGAAGKAGITVSGTNNSLTIYGQAEGTGKLIANGAGHANGTGGGAGIGGADMCGGGNITINGGDITAYGGGGGAGIGGGTDGTAYNIEVNRGTVVANGSLLGTGIGEGATTWSQKPNTISTVTLAKGGTVVDSLGIEWNTSDKVYVYDGTTLCGTLTCRNYDGNTATFTGDITAGEGAALSFHRYGSGVTGADGGPVATVFTGQDGTLATLKSNSDLAATGVTYSADGRYDITLGAPYAVLKLDLSALGTAGGNVVTISAGGGTVASVTGVKNTSTAVYVAMPAAQSRKYTISGNGKTAGVTWELAANTYYTKAGSPTGEPIVIIVSPTVTTGSVTVVSATSATGGGNVTADGGATVTERGICWGTSANPTIDGSHAAAATAGTGEFSSIEMTGLTTGATYYMRAYATNAAGTSYGADVTFTPQHVYVDLGLPSGTLWATCNVGAETPEDYGDYFAWGETEPYYADGHSQDNPCSTWRSMTTGAGNTDISNGYEWNTYSQGASSSFVEWNPKPYNTSTKILNSDRDAANANWGGEWRMPTSADFAELFNATKTSRSWTADYKDTGVAGYIVTSKKEGYTDKSIFIPAAGYRYGTSLYNAGFKGYYCSSSLHARYPYYAYNLYFDSNRVTPQDYRSRYSGFTVRPVQ